MILLFIFLVLGLAFVPGGPLAQPPPGRPAATPPPLPEVRLPYFQFPENITLCGEPVPLHEPSVKEALDREFTVIVWSRAQTTLWVKRAHRFFPDIVQRLREKRLPLDLKYVVLVESDLRPYARSSAGALGPWQFMEPTAQRFELKTTESIDERLDLATATEAALRYLQTLYRQFNSWPLALAAYNCGEGRLRKEIEAQGVNDFYHLDLPEETERYIHRILAAKVILENPAVYGYELPDQEHYQPLEYEVVELVAVKEVAVRDVAAACGTYYKTIKELNPWIKARSLPPGTYRLRVPQGASPRLKEMLKGLISAAGELK
ncbi:MAG: lytic transglycosylase domain-containing protein [Deltaproteobacteria bacterium]|nr:lytic transglycosylase domain-containing protein [Deltaproteobacteria bacterium]